MSSRMRFFHAACLLFLTGLLVIAPVAPAFSHPGRTASDGCHYCRTNCSKWGEVQDQRHCHGGGSSSGGSGSSSSAPPPPPPPPADTTPPRTPTAKSTSVDGSNVSLTAEAEERSLLRLRDASGATIASVRATGDPQPIQVTLPDGDHRLELTATDAAGNVSPARAVNVTVDTTPPAAPQITVRASSDATQPWTILEIAGESRTRWTLEVDGESKSGTIPTSGLAAVELLLGDGEYSAMVLLKDGYGNSSEATNGAVVVALPTPPAPVLAVGSDPGETPVVLQINGVPEGQATVAALADPSLSATVELDADGQGIAELDLPDGEYVIAGTVTDFQGRESAATELKVLVDVTPPPLEVTIDGALLRVGRLAWSVVSESGARIAMSGVDGLPSEVTLAGVTDGGEIELPSGEYEIRVVAADPFGHETEKLLSVRIESPVGGLELLFGLGFLAALVAAVVWAIRQLIGGLRSRWAARRGAA